VIRPRPRRVRLVPLALAFAVVTASCSGDGGAVSTTAAPLTTSTASAATTTIAPTTTVPRTTTTSVSTTAGPLQKPHGGEAVVVLGIEPATLNPLVPGGDELEVSIVAQGYTAGVQDIDGATLQIVPELVTELPTVANGGISVAEDGTMTIRYTIRDDAVWSDGEPITGEDFQFTLDIILDRSIPTVTTVYEDIIDSAFTEKTFEYTLSAATNRHESLFNTIVPKHAVEGTNFINDWNETMWPSAGPFVVAEWQRGEFIRLVRNENYWKTDPVTEQQLPYLDSVVFMFVPDTNQAVNAFQAREADVIQPPPSASIYATLTALEGEGAVVSARPGPIWEHLNFQFGENRLDRNPQSANSNLNFRKAVAHAIDKQLIVDELLEGQLEPLDSFVEVFAPSLSQGSWAQYDYDPEKARTFAEAARTDLGVETLKVVFSTTSDSEARVELSELLVDMFSAVGIEYENQLEDSQIFIGETLDFGQWDMGAWAWSSAPGYYSLVSFFDLVDPDAPPPDGQNFYRWGTPEVTRAPIRDFRQGPSSVIDENSMRFAELRDEMNETFDTAQLGELITEAERILADQVIFIPLYARTVTAAAWADELGGFVHNPSSAGFTWNIEDWYRKDM